MTLPATSNWSNLELSEIGRSTQEFRYSGTRLSVKVINVGICTRLFSKDRFLRIVVPITFTIWRTANELSNFCTIAPQFRQTGREYISKNSPRFCQTFFEAMYLTQLTLSQVHFVVPSPRTQSIVPIFEPGVCWG